jgi:hypothetical protein
LPKKFPAPELAAALGAAPVKRRRVRSGGYGTNSSHWCVELADGRRTFVKVALDDNAAEWLRQEHRVYSSIEAPFIPELVGWHDGDETLLAIADLSDAHWPPPWTAEHIEAVCLALNELHATRPPDGLPRAILVDWNLAEVGNPLLDIVAWLPSLKLEGGPDPWELVPDSQGLAGLVAGYFAGHAGLPPPATAPRVREFQLRQAEVALPWAARELGLPQP